MGDDARKSARELAQEYLAKGDGLGWFDDLYGKAEGDASKVPWADLNSNPLMSQQLDGPLAEIEKGECVVVGCGLGDDAEELARRGFNVTAFDVSPNAINWCITRWPNTEVKYKTADLTSLPTNMIGRFRLVVEINTLQAVPDELRGNMLGPLASLLRQGGTLLLICRRRDEGEEVEGPPWAISRSELMLLEKRHGLRLRALTELTDGEDPPKRRYIAIYNKPGVTGL